jgi:hypothetical protein
MEKIDIFYYATIDGIPGYYQPETGEVFPRNKICEWLMSIQEYLWNIFGCPEQFRIVIHHKTITRKEIEKK